MNYTPERDDEHFRLLVENAHDYAIFMLDLDGCCVSWNPGVERLLGYNENDFLGLPAAQLFTPEDRERGGPEEEKEQSRLLGRAPDDRWHVRQNGSRFFASGVMTALRDPAGVLRGFGKVMRDNTAAVQAEQALRESEERFRMVVEAVKDYAIFFIDSNGSVRTWNEGARALLGYEEDEIVGQNFSRFFVPEDVQSDLPARERATALEHGRSETEGMRVRKDGSRFLANEVITVVRGENGAVKGFSKIIRDITERQRAEDVLRTAKSELEERVRERTAELSATNQARQDLLRRLVDAQEEERRHLSRELHDQTGQHLAALTLGLKTLEQSAGASSGEPAGLIKRLQTIADDLAREVHELSTALRPTALDDLGLHATLMNYVEEWGERHQVAADFHGNGLDAERLPPVVETTIYRVVQEALTNVSRHADARHVSVILEKREQAGARAIIEDDGVGFDADATAGRRLGLLGMRERAALAGGTLRVESSPGKGTTVFLRIPLPVAGGE